MAIVVALMLVSVAGLTIGESGISALFFDRVGPDSLPVMYLGQGAVGVAGMLLLSGALGRFERRRAYVALPVLMAAVVAIERAVAAGGPSWIYSAMWLTTTAAYLVQAVYLWGTAGLVTDTRRAKRLFPLFGAGSILGAVAGGLATRPLASAIGAANLLVVWAVALVGDVARVDAFVRGGRRRSRSSGGGSSSSGDRPCSSGSPSPRSSSRSCSIRCSFRSRRRRPRASPTPRTSPVSSGSTGLRSRLPRSSSPC